MTGSGSPRWHPPTPLSLAALSVSRGARGWVRWRGRSAGAAPLSNPQFPPYRGVRAPAAAPPAEGALGGGGRRFPAGVSVNTALGAAAACRAVPCRAAQPLPGRAGAVAGAGRRPGQRGEDSALFTQGVGRTWQPGRAGHWLSCVLAPPVLAVG